MVERNSCSTKSLYRAHFSLNNKIERTPLLREMYDLYMSLYVYLWPFYFFLFLSSLPVKTRMRQQLKMTKRNPRRPLPLLLPHLWSRASSTSTTGTLTRITIQRRRRPRVRDSRLKVSRKGLFLRWRESAEKGGWFHLSPHFIDATTIRSFAISLRTWGLYGGNNVYQGIKRVIVG